jgi:putative acetyltransferase
MIKNKQNMITFKRTTSDNEDFEKLVKQLDAYLAIVDGEDHAFYAQFNKSNSLKNALVAYEKEIAIGIGAYKEYDSQTVEMKRMFTIPEHRGKGIASKILSELELWAKEENYSISILETGFLQKEAISLYQKLEYKIIENYGQYKGVETSICMKKTF